MKKRLEFAHKGKNFLDYKREELILELKENWDVYNKSRKEFLDTFKKSLLLLNESYKSTEKNQISLMSNLSQNQFKPRLTLKHTKRIGILVTRLFLHLKSMKGLPPFSFESTGQEIDDLVHDYLKNLIQSLLKFAEKEDLMLKLAVNFQKLNRRINGLKNIIIPNLDEEIKKIKNTLEELNRENFIRLKKTKELIQKNELIW